MDLDGTLTQHKSRLDTDCRDTLNKISTHYHILMVCAGGCERVYRQMNCFPVNIIGYYGMQFSTVNNGELMISEDMVSKIDKDSVNKRVEMLRQELKLTEYYGDSVEFHPSGMITFPILGTKAPLNEKLAYDSDREKRRKWYDRVKNIFFDYNVYIGGSSSYDIVPPPYCKLYALRKYAAQKGIESGGILFFGDDYGIGGNDSDVYHSDVNFTCIDNYRDFPAIIEKMLL